ncbi:MAG: aldehyde:ferredoxin oxidoreductase [Clostridia bacterium]|nr:aldehyde:ferredoxin oxidoreductase [Clostridia bacterium]
MPKILRINLTAAKISYEELPDEYALWGNRGLIARYLLDEVPPTCHPLGEYNKLILATGPLAGSNVTSSARLSAGAKSPLTGGIKESNAGGVAGRLLARLGLRALILEGRAKELSILKVGKEGAELIPAPELKGLGNYDLASRLLNKYGNKSGIISIGQAGEKLFPTAGIFVTDPAGSPSRACGRGGLGAVMGSKNLKAVVIENNGNENLRPVNPDAYRRAVKEFHSAILQHPQTSKAYPEYGTAGLLSTMNRLGGLPTRNFSSGSFEGAEKICGEALRALILDRGGEGRTTHRCMDTCIIRCSNIFPDPEGRALVSPLEYETLVLLGSNIGVDNLDWIAKFNRLCNDFGIDTIEIGAAIGVAMEAGILNFGNARKVEELLKEVGEGTLLGRVIGQGAEITGRVLGVTRVPTVKGQAMAAHEPRAIKGMTVTYATSPMGADHTAGITVRAQIDHRQPEGQMELSRNTQVNVAAYDTLGFCIFVMPAVGGQPQLAVNILNALYGTDYRDDFLRSLGKKVIRLEKAFNEAAGFTEAHDRLPEFFYSEKLPPYNVVSDIPAEDIKRFWDPDFWEE